MPDVHVPFLFEAEDGIRGVAVTGVQTCALPISMPLIDDAGMEAVHETVGGEFDLLLGRRTYDNWIGYWPRHEDDPIGAAFAKATKYVVTHRPDGLAWPTSKRIGGDVVAEVRRLKTSKGPPLHLWGSSEVLHRLAAADLVDEFRVWVFPVLLGAGKRLFGPDMPPPRPTLGGTTRRAAARRV